ncbi:PfkB family carbohydrate kinase [Sinorhizobium meliloti]|uniref:PfkB family carbohydrate kinase n=1 Tax=Rhizobium meliloti TaxID=382 RepID=UPI000FD9AFCD|nr:hypothetical protein CN212_06975 [Sinorhizobium meliloti]
MQSSASPGGNGANQALAARRAGAGVRLAGAIGHDPVGADALALLKDASVDLSLVRAVKHSTGTAHVVVDAVGENSVVALVSPAKICKPGPLQMSCCAIFNRTGFSFL